MGAEQLVSDAYNVMDLKALRCFWAVAKFGSFTQACIELGISEPAVSQRVKQLELYLDTKLYEARGGRVHLTPSGERTMEKAVSIFRELEEFKRSVSTEEESINITLCTHDTVLRYLLTEVVSCFSREHPLARLRLLTRTVEDTVHLVRTNEADMGIIPERQLPRDLRYEKVATYPAYLIFPKGHVLIRRGKTDFKSLWNEETVHRYSLIVSEIQLEGRLLQEFFDRQGLPLSIGLEVSTIDTLKHYVARGLGIAAVSGLCLTEADRSQFDIIEIPPDLGADTTYGMILRHDKHLNGPLKTLISLVKDV